tara:strand:- start:11671 stop:12936 length:1266 start_codon:yes stop_codon:yes gene_type:complete
LSKLLPVRGTHDIIGEDFRLQNYVIKSALTVAETFGYEPIETPIFESTDVYQRTLGETSDIVNKEMYTFKDKGGDSLTLRPEGTAGIARAVISGGLQDNTPLKWYYSGPMFRHERPQKGRLRQFHQFGAELIGIADPAADVEVISMATEFLRNLGLLSEVKLQLNTLGDFQSRKTYRESLINYFSDFKDNLSEESQVRLTRNPLRILDSKDSNDKEIVSGAPSFHNFLTPEADSFFKNMCSGLDNLGIEYLSNPYLVRGLDYYCHTTFEFISDKLGAQGTLLAGGRYDGLIPMMGGQSIPGVGWAAGIERICMLTQMPTEEPRAICVIGLGEPGEKEAAKIALRLRRSKFKVDLIYKGGLKRGLRRANKIGAVAAILLGENELTNNNVTVRNLDNGSQTEVSLSELDSHLAVYESAKLVAE